jgi:hypothetical protein
MKIGAIIVVTMRSEALGRLCICTNGLAGAPAVCMAPERTDSTGQLWAQHRKSYLTP